MQEAGTDQAAADNVAHQFAASVLVHEHFHSAIANGLDSRGRVSLGSATAEAWAAASSLNESFGRSATFFAKTRKWRGVTTLMCGRDNTRIGLMLVRNSSSRSTVRVVCRVFEGGFTFCATILKTRKPSSIVVGLNSAT
jgi:hypothetical protein